MLQWCMTQVIHNSATTVPRLGRGRKVGERDKHLHLFFQGKRDITRGALLVQTYQSLHDIFSSTQQQQMSCTKRSSSQSPERNIMSMSSFQSLINCKEFSLVSLYSENNSLDKTGCEVSHFAIHTCQGSGPMLRCGVAPLKQVLQTSPHC